MVTYSYLGLAQAFKQVRYFETISLSRQKRRKDVCTLRKYNFMVKKVPYYG